MVSRSSARTSEVRVLGYISEKFTLALCTEVLSTDKLVEASSWESLRPELDPGEPTSFSPGT